MAQRLAGGESWTLPQVVAGHQERIGRLASRLLGWRGDIEDVVQDVFVSALANLARFRGESQLTTWLYRITVNECRRARRRRRLREMLRLVSDAAAPPERAHHGSDRSAAIRQAIVGLPPKYREVVVLRYLEELRVPEVAVILNVSTNVVDVRLHRAREQLRTALAGWLEV